MIVLENFVWQDLLNPATWLGAVFYAVALVVAAMLAGRLVRMAAAKTLAQDSQGHLDRMLTNFLTRLAVTGVWLGALLVYAHLIPSLSKLATALLASASLLTLVIGLAAQNTLGNLIAGIALMIYRPFHVGDRVQVNAPTGLETGVIEDLELGFTVLQTFDNRRVVIPNSVMLGQTTINMSVRDARMLAIVNVGVAYDADIDAIRGQLIGLARNHPAVQEVTGCPVTQLGDFAVNLSLRAWCANFPDAKRVEMELYEQITKLFGQEGIQFPSPTTNVILSAAGGPVNVSFKPVNAET